MEDAHFAQCPVMTRNIVWKMEYFKKHKNETFKRKKSQTFRTTTKKSLNLKDISDLSYLDYN